MILGMGKGFMHLKVCKILISKMGGQYTNYNAITGCHPVQQPYNAAMNIMFQVNTTTLVIQILQLFTMKTAINLYAIPHKDALNSKVKLTSSVGDWRVSLGLDYFGSLGSASLSGAASDAVRLHSEWAETSTVTPRISHRTVKSKTPTEITKLIGVLTVKRSILLS